MNNLAVYRGARIVSQWEYGREWKSKKKPKSLLPVCDAETGTGRVSKRELAPLERSGPGGNRFRPGPPGVGCLTFDRNGNRLCKLERKARLRGNGDVLLSGNGGTRPCTPRAPLTPQ